MKKQSLFNKLFNTPPNYDEISKKKTRNSLISYLILLIICIVLIIGIVIKDSSERITFVSSEIQNDVILPSIKLTTVKKLNQFYQFLINDMSVNEIPGLYPYSDGFYCFKEIELEVINPNYICENNGTNGYPNNQTVINFDSIELNSFEASFKRNYLSIDAAFQLNNYEFDKIEITFDGKVYWFSTSIDVQMLVSKQIDIDKYNNEKVSFITNVVTSSRLSETLPNYRENGTFFPGEQTSLSIYYESNIVNIFTQETNTQLVLRILKDIFAVCKLVITLALLLSVYIQNRFTFSNKSAFYQNTIRDSVLYFLKNKPVCDDSFKMEQCGKLKVYKSREEEIEIETNGSQWRLVRLVQSLPICDSIGPILKKVTLIQWLVFIAVVIAYVSYIGVKDFENRLVITKYSNEIEIQLPKINVNYSSQFNNFKLLNYDESLPNGNELYCDISISQTIENCDHQTKGIASFNKNDKGIYSNWNLKEDVITLLENQSYSMNTSIEYQMIRGNPSFDLVQIVLTIGDVNYLLRPFNTINVQLSKTVFHYLNGTNVTFYDPSFTQSTSTLIDTTPSIQDEKIYISNTLLNISYTDYIVKNVYVESNTELAFRFLTDVGAFITPFKLIIVFIFSFLLVRLIFSDPTACVDNEIRDSVLFHMRYFDKYSKIYKGNSK